MAGKIPSPVKHVPVLLQEVLSLAQLRPGQTVLDCTLGLGGYAAAFAAAVGPSGTVIGLELDDRNLSEATRNLSPYGNVILIRENFRNARSAVEATGHIPLDAVIFDLGLSSPHVDEAQRGFSYKLDGPLDMRFSTQSPLTAAELVNEADERLLETILKRYGEEPQAWRIAQAIVKRRASAPITTTRELVDCINGTVREDLRGQTVKRVFQALRMEVNDEMESIRLGLQGAFDSLGPQGKLIVVSYHSLEDAITKDFFRSQTSSCICQKESPICTCQHPFAENLTPKPIVPSDTEQKNNPRSRSAKLRAIRKL